MAVGVILAAGRGTRMGALTAETPKPLLCVHGRPILEHILCGVRDAGISECAVVVGYRGEQVRTALGSGERLGLRLSYRVQKEPHGTARAFLLARDAIGDRPSLLSWGDIIVRRDNYARLAETFRRQPCDALLLVNSVDDPWRGAAVYIDETGRVQRLVEKPPRGTSRTRWNNAGIAVLAPIVIRYAERLTPSTRGEYELPQAIAAMIADGRTVRAIPVQGFWSDLGTPEDLAAAERNCSW